MARFGTGTFCVCLMDYNCIVYANFCFYEISTNYVMVPVRYGTYLRILKILTETFLKFPELLSVSFVIFSFVHLSLNSAEIPEMLLVTGGFKEQFFKVIIGFPKSCHSSLKSVSGFSKQPL